MNFTLTVLGTASAMPISERFQSAQVLSVRGRLFLIDCGEGVQLQMVRYGISLEKIESVFISHIHGDHVFGLFGFLSTLGMKKRTAPLDVYGPLSLGSILNFYKTFFSGGNVYEIRFHPLSMKKPEVIYASKAFEILAFPLNHKIETFGYLFREKEPHLNIRKEDVERYGFTLSEIGKLKQGEDVIRPAGTDKDSFFFSFDKHSGTDQPLVIKASEVAYKPFNPRSYAYCSDTAPFPELSSWVKGVDLLYHEATYLQEFEDQAKLRHHSTTLQAAKCALDAQAGKLLIAHYSSRSKDISKYQKECRSIFPETYAAKDGDVYDLPYVKLN